MSFFSAKVPLMLLLLHYVFLFVLFLLLSPPILAAAQTTTKKSSCPLIGENADITKGNDEEITSFTKPLRSSCGSDILSSDGACTICASAIDTLILSRIPLTSEELRTFDMKACGAFFIESGASVTTLLGMRKCEREESAAYRTLLNEEKGRKQGGGGGEEEEEEEERRKEDKAGRDPSVLYCFLFFCSFPLLDIGISEKLIPFYFAFVFIISLGVLSVMLCKLFLVRQRQRRRRKEKEITREDDVGSQSPSRLTS